ncbi:MAG: hypothetical protein IPG72_09655 [Ardenticatenales bacterium]|nr:hypothetical protein [Ardenticatenales bacterium]
MSDRAPVLLKLGGALLTDKDGIEAVRSDVLTRVAAEVAAWRADDPDGAPLVIAHGSGSFAHVAARRTRFLDRPGDPAAFAVVASSAARLHRHVVDALIEAGLPAIGVPGGALATLDAGRIIAVRSDLVGDLLAFGAVPVTYGDAALDRSRGGGIASTEPLLVALAEALGAARLVFATDVDGVYDRDPAADQAARRYDRLSPGDPNLAALSLGGARAGATDVTGGMASKVGAALALVARRPGVTVRIVSGLRVGAVGAALRGAVEAGGTVVEADPGGGAEAGRG